MALCTRHSDSVVDVLHREMLGHEGRAIAVLAAMESDLSAVRKEADAVGGSFEFNGRPVYQARLEGQPMLLAKTGATPEAARAITQWLVQIEMCRQSSRLELRAV